MPSTDKPLIELKNKEPFSSGGNRLCFRHPDDRARCLKVIRPDRTPDIRRAEKGFPANLRPLKAFDENLVEESVLRGLLHRFPSEIRRHLPQSYGMIDTDLGPAHETDLICDADGLISQTLEQYIWKYGIDMTVQTAISEFKQDWSTRPPNTRDLIPHNFVIHINESKGHLYLIDGYGRPPRIKWLQKDTMSASRLRRRFENFDHRIALILERKANNNGPKHRINNLKRT